MASQESDTTELFTFTTFLSNNGIFPLIILLLILLAAAAAAATAAAAAKSLQSCLTL